MFNFRQVSSKYYLSGGWMDIKTDPEFLSYYNIKAVLDLQYTNELDEPITGVVLKRLDNLQIAYAYLLMEDTDTYFPADLDDLFDNGHDILTGFEEQFPKPGHKILVKCGLGTSRSPAILAYHLCKRDNISYQAILNMFRDAEQGVTMLGSNPNDQFSATLRKRFPFK